MKRLVGNIKGPAGPQGPQGPPGDVLPSEDLTTIASLIEDNLTDIPDLSLLFENNLV